ncbi:MAG: hypothetical protein ABIH00_06280 [Armatimonadota bacterium]
MDFNAGNIFNYMNTKGQELSEGYNKLMKQLPDMVNTEQAQKPGKKEDLPEFVKQAMEREPGSLEGDKTGEKIQRKMNADAPAKPTAGAAPQGKPGAAPVAKPPAPQAPQVPQIVKPPSTPEEFAQRFDQEVSKFLAKYNIPDTPQNRIVAKTLMSLGGQLVMQRVQRVNSALAQVANQGKEEQQSACYLEKNNKPLSKENITDLSSYVKENKQVSNKIIDIQQTAAQVARITQNARFATVFSKLSTVMGRLVSQPGVQSVQEMKVALFKLAQSYGVEKDISQAAMRQINLERGTQNTEAISRQIDFGKLASALSSLTDQSAVSAAEKALLLKVVDLAGQLSQNVSGARLINDTGLARTTEGAPGFCCIDIPVKMMNKEFANGKLILTFQPYARNIDPENVAIDLRIETKRLGFLQFILNIVNNAVQGNIYVESEKVKELVEKNIVSFKRAILAQLYQIKYIKCDTIEEEKALFLSDFNFDNIEVLANTA